MSYVRDRNVGVQQPQPDLCENTQAGPLTTTTNPGPGAATHQYAARKVSIRSRLEKAGSWVVVAAALAVLLVLMGFVLPPVVGGIITGGYIALFAAALTLMNLSRPSRWANSLMGRRAFPVLRAPDGDIWRLARVNGALTFVFVFFFTVIASFLGSFLAGLIVFGGLIAAGVFYSRAQRVIIKP